MKQKQAAIFVIAITLAAGSCMPTWAEEKASSSPTPGAVVGDFSISVPKDWTSFKAQEAANFEQQYQQQSRDIYQHFAGKDDPTKSVRVTAFHTPGKNGIFVIVVMSLPAQANLIPMLKEQIQPKMQYGIQQGIISKYIGIVPVRKDQLTGFYTKAIGRNGNIQVSGGLEHSRKKSTIVQLTLLAPDGWSEDTAVSALDKILASMKLVGE